MESTVPWPGRCWPAIVSVGRFTQEDRGFTRDYRNDCLTLHLFAYPCRMRSGELELVVRPDHLVLTPPQAAQAFDIPHPGRHWALLVRPARGAALLALPRHLALTRAQAAELASRLERVCEDHQRGGEAAALAASAGAQATLCWLAALLAPDAATVAGKRTAAALRKAEDLLSNPLCAALPIAEVARRAGLSQNRLASAFQLRHGVTMHAYRDRALLAFVQQWLESTDRSMTVIARQIELPDARRFNKWFRRLTGLSPSAWRAGRAPVVTSAARPEMDIAQPPVAPPPRRVTPPG